MFGYAGESEEQLTGMIARRVAAQERWPFLTTLDLSMIQDELQLASTISDRTGISSAKAEAQVREWLVDLPAGKARSTSIQRWIDDDGAGRKRPDA